MDAYLSPYIVAAAVGLAGVAFVALAYGANRLLAPRHPTPEKVMTYESGVDPVGEGWAQTHIRYYLFAFMFVVFDVETLFVFPWAVFLGDAGNAAPRFMLGVMLVFLFFVSITLPYEWKKGVLKWV